MSKPLGYEGMRLLEVGDQVEYKAGKGDHRVEATVTISQPPGSTGVFVILDTIHLKGDAATVSEGEAIIAGREELFRPAILR